MLGRNVGDDGTVMLPLIDARRLIAFEDRRAFACVVCIYSNENRSRYTWPTNSKFLKMLKIGNANLIRTASTVAIATYRLDNI